MENLAPPLILLWEVKRSLEKGQSVGAGIKTYLRRVKVGAFRTQIETWWSIQNSPQIFKEKSLVEVSLNMSLSPKRRYLLEILEVGLKGHGILQTLSSLETELISDCEDEIQHHVANLPLRALVPLMLFIFPSMMLLLVIPLLKLLKF